MPPQLTLTDSSPTPLANQVAGHDGVMSDASGSLVIKPALPREIAFYQTLNSASKEDPIRRFKPFVPRFYGTLRLEGQLSSTGDVERLHNQGKEEVPESVVIENLSHAFTHPNIMDVKLGTVLYGPDASDEKRARMDKQARETTTHETGVRLTGCQTWHAPSSSYISTPKSFGKTISVSQLPSGMVRFFPLPTDTIGSLVIPPSPPPTATTATSTTSSAGVIAPASDLPIIPVSTSLGVPPTPVSANGGLVRSTTTASNPVLPNDGSYRSHAISPTLLVKVLDIVLSEIDQLIGVLTDLEIRFVGGSVLIVYEGDPTRLASAIERYESRRAIKALKAANPESPALDQKRSAFSDDGSNDDDESDSGLSGSDSDSDEEDDDDDDEDDDIDGTKEDERNARRCPPVRVKMIDFAHTWLAQGEGPDQGVLKGLETLKRLIQGRKKEVEAAMI
ncbi:hypothetical protein I317_01682 [Kwoniella heveanensis CBS 569]|nr:hypothetical protein I317_01682 [Kwoniella heveanensis CBS 569]